MTRTQKNLVLFLSMPLAVLVAVASMMGLLSPDIYVKETPDWVAQAVAQDAMDLFLVVPLMTIAALFVYRQERLAEPIWGGSLLYLIYTFIIYSFSVHFNVMFLVYVLALGLSAYSFLYFMILQRMQPTIKGMMDQRPARFIGIYFLVIAVLFYGLWLAEVVPAVIGGYTPATVTTAGLFTNPVQAVDLSFFLPGIFITGILLLRQHTLAMILAPVLLVFFVLMDITITVIMAVQYTRGSVVSPAVMIVMTILALVSAVCLSWLLRKSY
jgi:hypothetical protein